MLHFGNRLTWNALSINGIRQAAEVALDELVVTGMTLLSSPPELPRPIEEYAAAAGELAALGVRGAHRDPEPLRVGQIRSVPAGALSYERMRYEHDPRLVVPLAAEGHGGPALAEVVLFRHDDGPRPWLVWVHGAGQGGMSDILVARAGRIHRELGFNVAMPVQPGHGLRRNRWPAIPVPTRWPTSRARSGGVRGPGGDRVDRTAGHGDRPLRAVAG